jgi:S1-C subfamily serine protease
MQGFIVGALSLFGFAVGAFIGTRLAPLVLNNGARSPYAPLLGLLGALLAGGVLASGLEGIGVRVRSGLRLRGLRTVDGLLGAALTACVGLGVAWIVGAVALQTDGSRSLGQEIQRSAILTELNQLLPPSGPILNALARFDPLPSVHGPAADVPAPTRGILGQPSVHEVAASVVRVFGSACGLGIEGSGWVAAPGIVVTNAHVVAGESDTAIQVGGIGPGRSAEVLDFDSRDDVAVLRVGGLQAPALQTSGNARPGTSAAILGYPLDGAFNVEPARVGQTNTVATENAYGEGHVLRTITALRGRVQPGNSGGPLVDVHGHVLATIFAALTGTTHPGGFAVPNSVVRSQLDKALARDRPVGTGRCG